MPNNTTVNVADLLVSLTEAVATIADRVAAIEAVPAPAAKANRKPKAAKGKTVTCKAPTAEGERCSRAPKGSGGMCKTHQGRTAAQWAARHAEVAAKREEYLAKREARLADGPQVRFDNKALAAYAREQGVWGVKDAEDVMSWTEVKEAYGHLFIG